jgi:lysophospholipase L1-like esterase/dienelactone hydrolase
MTLPPRDGAALAQGSDRARRVAIVSDSTPASYPKPPADRPTLTGWGQVFGHELARGVVLLNHAASGRSSRSFIDEGRWTRTLADHPDWVLIQFGHNDQKEPEVRGTDPAGSFRDYLRRYLRDARQAQVRPVLVTPVARRTYSEGKPTTSLTPYADAMVAVGREENVPVIDLHGASMRLYGRLGDAGSADFSPGLGDRTHFSHSSAREIARLVADGIYSAVSELRPFLRGRQDPHHDLSWFPDGSGARTPIRTTADWEKRRAALLPEMHRAMGPLPGPEQRVPLDVRVEEETRLGKVTRRKISYQSSPKQRVPAYLFLPERKGDGRAAAVLCLHPTGELGKGIVAGLGGRANRQYAAELAQRGFVTLAPDYPSFGEYRCSFDPADGFQSGSMRAIWDNIRGIDLLETVPAVDPRRVGAIGHSLGGHNALYTAMFEPRIRAVVSSCGFTRFHRYRDGKLAPWAQACYMPRISTLFQNDPDQVPFDFPEIIAALAPRAFFTNSPVRDSNFDVQGVRDCIAAARPIYERYGRSEALKAIHPDCEHDFPDDARSQAYGFLEQQLK